MNEFEKHNGMTNVKLNSSIAGSEVSNPAECVGVLLMGVLCVGKIVASATGLSLLQRSPTGYEI